MNWSFGLTFAVQKQAFFWSIPDYQFKGDISTDALDYYKWFNYKVSIQKRFQAVFTPS
jgi:hypothetical protein